MTWFRALCAVLVALQLLACGNPSVIAYTRGRYFERLGLTYSDEEDPLGPAGRQKFTQAIDQFDAAIKLQPKYREAFIHRGDCHSHLSNYKAALYDFSEAIALEPNDTAAWKMRAETQVVFGNFKQAMDDYAKVLSIDKDDISALLGKAECQQWLGMKKESLADYDRALTINGTDDEHMEVYRQRAYAYCRDHNYGAMEKDFDVWIKDDPNDVERYQCRGYGRFASGDYSGAILDFRRVLGKGGWHDKQSVYAVVYLAISLRLLHHDEESKDWLRRAISQYQPAANEKASEASRHRVVDLPGAALLPLILFLDGQITQQDLLAATKDNLDRQTECQCFIGLQHLADGDNDGAKQAFSWVVKNGNRQFIEYDICVQQDRRLHANSNPKSRLSRT